MDLFYTITISQYLQIILSRINRKTDRHAAQLILLQVEACAQCKLLASTAYQQGPMVMPILAIRPNRYLGNAHFGELARSALNHKLTTGGQIAFRLMTTFSPISQNGL